MTARERFGALLSEHGAMLRCNSSHPGNYAAVLAAADAMVVEEREACLLIVEHGADEGPVLCVDRGCIAAAIRKRGE